MLQPPGPGPGIDAGVRVQTRPLGHDLQGQGAAVAGAPGRERKAARLLHTVARLRVLVMAVPSHGYRDVAAEAARFLRPWVPVLSLAKGLEVGTRLRMTEVIEQELPGHPSGVLAGPNLAKEVLAGFAAAAVIAMPDAEEDENERAVARLVSGRGIRPPR